METIDTSTGRLGLPYVTNEPLTGENYRSHLEENWGLIAESLNGRLVDYYGNQVTIDDWHTFLVYEALEPVYGEVADPEYGDTYTDVVGYSRPTPGRGFSSEEQIRDYDGDPLVSWRLETMQDMVARGVKTGWGRLPTVSETAGPRNGML